jgi:DNA-binding IclR family transcriptional regulator
MRIMPNRTFTREQIDRFIVDEIDSVPQLEALLLIWNRRPRTWTSADLSRELYVSADFAHEILRYLAQHRFVVEVEEKTGCYILKLRSEETEDLLSALDKVYRRELVRISNLIHEKSSRALRDFASAFRFKKEGRS